MRHGARLETGTLRSSSVRPGSKTTAKSAQVRERLGDPANGFPVLVLRSRGESPRVLPKWAMSARGMNYFCNLVAGCLPKRDSDCFALAVLHRYGFRIAAVKVMS